MLQNIDARLLAIGHVDIEDHEVPMSLSQPLQCFLRRWPLLADRADRRIPSPVIGPGKPARDHRMVVGNENALALPLLAAQFERSALTGSR